jgi:hypothetical protein
LVRNAEGAVEYQAVPTNNANALLLRDEWKEIDRAVSQAAREKLRVVADLRARGLTYSIPNGMGKMVLESQRMGDISPARIVMDPIARSENDRPEYDMIGVPLPVVEKDFYFSARQIAVSRNSGNGLDITMPQMAARRCAEEVEKLTLGVSDSYSYAGYTVYGFRNYPGRLTQALTDPTDLAWTPAVFLGEVLAMKQKLVDDHHYGPYLLYLSPAWSAVLDNDFTPTYGNLTLRERLAKIENIQLIATADHLPTYDVLMIQASTETVRLIIGMEFTTIQWNVGGGMEERKGSDFDSQTGVCHGAVA